MSVLVSGDDNEYRLVRDLMRNYDPRIRPSRNHSEALNVTFGLALAQIIDVVSSAHLPLVRMRETGHHVQGSSLEGNRGREESLEYDVAGVTTVQDE